METAPSPNFDISDVELEGEAEDDVKVFNTCDEIRKKINAHLRKGGITNAAFLRELRAQFHTDSAPKSIQSAQLTRFRGMNGPTAGNASSVFYAAYVYFEKLRIKEGKAKSKHMDEIQRKWPMGVETDRRVNGHFWVPGGKTPHVDQYGMVSVFQYLRMVATPHSYVQLAGPLSFQS